MRRWPLVSLCLALAVLFSTGRARAQREIANPPSPVFEFHSGFWVNLHHFLYLQGRIRNGAAESGASASAAERYYRLAAATDGLTPDQQKEWNAAVKVYTADWSTRDLSNSDMVLINNRLAELENCTDISSKAVPGCQAGLRPDIVAAIERAAPIYRARWWDEQDRANRIWIDAAAPLVGAMGATLAAQLADTYERPWPTEHIRVDVAWYAGPQGAYTSLDPTHVTVGGYDPRNQGLVALEVLFHEASHAVAQGVNQAIIQECRDREVPIPRELWHALLFYTTGEVIGRTIEEAPPGVTGAAPGAYVPYADRNGLWDDGWSRYRDALEKYWQPYLDGRVPFHTAIERIIEIL